MPIIVQAILGIVLVALVVWAVNRFLTTIDAEIRMIFNIVAIMGLIWWLLDLFGLIAVLMAIKIGAASLAVLLLVIALVGIALYLITKYLPLGEPYMKILRIVCVVGLIIWIVLSVLGTSLGKLP